MNTTIDQLLQIFTNFFQSDFELLIDGNVYKSGKFINLSAKEFFIKFLFLDKKRNKQKHIEIPAPYKFELNNNILTLDYTLSTLCDNNDNILIEINKVNLTNPSVFYNKKITFVFDIK